MHQAMPTESTSSVDLRQAFVIASDDARKLDRLLRDRVGSASYTASCEDGIERVFDSVAKLEAFENARDHQIVSLKVHARAQGDPRKSAWLHFSGRNHYSISGSLSGSDLVVTRLRPDLMRVLEGLRPWYARLARIDLISVGVFGYFALWISASVYLAVKGSGEPSSGELSPKGQAQANVVVWAIPAIIFGGGWVLNRLKARWFPVGTFAFGQGRKRHSTLEVARWTILVGFTVSLAATIVGAAIL